MPNAAPRRFQDGVMLLEALIAILIFSLGILAIIGLQAQSVRNSAEAKYRADASFLANQIIGRMWADRANLSLYAHRPAGAVCAPSGADSNHANVTEWLASVSNTLPGATAARQSIVVDAATSEVTVRICWPSRTGDHNLVVSTRING
jgi:type IV pilus assembly protein PilV